MKRAKYLFFILLVPPALALGQTATQAPYQEVIQYETKVDQQAQYPGGLPGLNLYVMRNLKYPPKAFQQKIEGKVLVKFTVGTTGEVTTIEVLKSDHELFEKEAKRLMKGMEKWLPASIEGKPVEVSYVFPLTFKQA